MKRFSLCMLLILSFLTIAYADDTNTCINSEYPFPPDRKNAMDRRAVYEDYQIDARVKPHKFLECDEHHYYDISVKNQNDSEEHIILKNVYGEIDLLACESGFIIVHQIINEEVQETSTTFYFVSASHPFDIDYTEVLSTLNYFSDYICDGSKLYLIAEDSVAVYHLNSRQINVYKTSISIINNYGSSHSILYNGILYVIDESGDIYGIDTFSGDAALIVQTHAFRYYADYYAYLIYNEKLIYWDSQLGSMMQVNLLSKEQELFYPDRICFFEVIDDNAYISIHKNAYEFFDLHTYSVPIVDGVFLFDEMVEIKPGL